jgi:acetyl-CoA carboxylase carboxyltransferase component
MWIDAVIDPTNTRKWISMGLALADHAPIEKKFSMGILQV